MTEIMPVPRKLRITVLPAGSLSPIIYLDGFYARYQQGESMEMLCDGIIEKCINAPELPLHEYRKIFDLSYVQENAVYKLVNLKQNQELLQDVPHLPMIDLAIVFCLLFPVDERENCSVLIRNEHLTQWKLPISVLYQYAKNNTPRLLPPVFAPLEEQFPEVFFETEESVPLYLLTNEAGFHGAGVLLYDRMPKWIYDQLKEPYYLLPSSVHEFLILPGKEAPEPSRLQEIVREINATQVEKEERLSDEVYYFDGNIITKI